MTEERESIVVYGAGGGARRALPALKRGYRVIALVDGDGRRHGSRVGGLRVEAPEALARLAYDRVYVASASFYPEIHGRLLAMGIPEERIRPVDPLLLHGEQLPITPFCVVYFGVAALLAAGLLWGLYLLY